MEKKEILGSLRQLSKRRLRGNTGISGEAGHRHDPDTTLPSPRTENENLAHDRGGGRLLKIILAKGARQYLRRIFFFEPSRVQRADVREQRLEGQASQGTPASHTEEE